MTPRIHTLFAVISAIIVGLAVTWGFAIVDSPATKRIERLDERRLDDLRSIARELQTLVANPDKKAGLKQPLPKTLDEAEKKVRTHRLNLRDPDTNQPYRYIVKNETTYELCATFTGRRESDASVFWNHPAGEACFMINVLDPPPYY
jgi:hypothetical protein